MSKIVTAARVLAALAHHGQMYGEVSYIRHCSRVVDILVGVNAEPDILAAAWLHDVLEDTSIDRRLIANRTNDRVADLVWACTGVGGTRRERNANIAEKLRECPAAAVIKVADRIDNVRSCWENRDSRLFMYHREYPEFRRVVLGSSMFTPLMAELDVLMGWRPMKAD